MCTPLAMAPLPLNDVVERLNVANNSGNWREALKWEGRMEEVIARQADDSQASIAQTFASNHEKGLQATGSLEHARAFVRWQERRIALLGKLQRFRDQGEAMCGLGRILQLKSKEEAASMYQRARKVGEAHGFFSVECSACQGLGVLAMNGGCDEEGAQLLRNALAAAHLNETDDPGYEIDSLRSLTYALLRIRAIDEVEPLVARYREAAKTPSGFSFEEMDVLVKRGIIHEVMCICTPRLGAPPNCFSQCSTRETTRAPVELCARWQARGRPQEAATEVRVALDLLHQNQTAAQDMAAAYAEVLKQASKFLQCLDPEVGEEELIKAVADAQTKLNVGPFCG